LFLAGPGFQPGDELFALLYRNSQCESWEFFSVFPIVDGLVSVRDASFPALTQDWDGMEGLRPDAFFDAMLRQAR
jgi:hypothetical protein